jgi:signal transduction histidine kinase
MLGQPIEMLVPKYLRDRHIEHRRRYLARPWTRPMGAPLNLTGERKDGRIFPVEISLSPHDFDSETLVTSVIRDVTERIRAEAERQELERQKDEFLANVSHDLRTPVAGIKASIGVVLANEPPDTPEPLHRMLVNIDLAANRMAKLVADLLELTRLRAGRVLLHPVQIDLREVAVRSVRGIEPLALERGQTVDLQLPADPVFGQIDVERLERALLNLLSNAHVYGRAGGIIRLSLGATPDEAIFSVTDDGPGIPTSEQAHIFERFYRSESETALRNRGSGLGLPIARAMVELHGGRIWVESNPGKGATFSIGLPLHPQPSSTCVRSSPAKSVPQIGKISLS